MKDALNFALVGCGTIAPVHARSLAELPGARLVAVCDIDEAKARRLAEAFPAAVCTDAAGMLKRDDIDVVSVLTPSGLHAEIGILAARAGKHVVVEKPIDVTLERADSLISACQDAGVRLSVISQHRFDPAIVELKRAIAENELGRLQFGGAYTQWYREQGYYDDPAWHASQALSGGGALMTQSIHYVDLLQYLMGPVAEVYAQCSTRAHDRIEVEDTAAAALRFRSGALGVVEGMTSACPGFCTRLEVFGAEGGVVIENDQVKEWQVRSGKAYHAPSAADKGIAGTSSADLFYLGHRRQLQEVLSAIREQRDPLVGGKEGRQPLEIILAMYASARSGKPINL